MAEGEIHFYSKLDESLSPAQQSVNFINTGPDFPYIYYIGVTTALKAYGGKVVLWIADRPESQYFGYLRDKVEIREIRDIPAFPALASLDNYSKRVMIFEHLIWKITRKTGGIIMGLDSITLKPHYDLFQESKELVCSNDNEKYTFLSMHGTIVRAGSEIAEGIYQDGLKVLSGYTKMPAKWGSIGANPFRSRCGENLDRITIMQFGLCSGFWHDGSVFYILRDDGELLHHDTRTIPLYARSIPDEVKQMDENYVAHRKALYSRLVKKLLSTKEWDPFGITTIAVRKRECSIKKRFHLLGLAHLPTNREEALACAFSQKVLKMARMLMNLGHEVIFYGVEGSTVESSEFVQVSEKGVLEEVYRKYHWGEETFVFQSDDFAYQYFNYNAIKEINKRKRPMDFLLIPMGFYQKAIAEAVGLELSVEMGIGYEGVYAKYKVFESYAWMHHVYGLQNIEDGHDWDCVIPNYFDPDDFEYSESKDDYFLYLGRLIHRKGIRIARQVVEHIGGKLLLAGPRTNEDVDIDSPNLQYVGFADVEKRKKLLSKAKALFVPTIYIGPFEGVSIEAAFSGTPVITTDWGAFAENVIHGKTGYRCRGLDQFVWAANNIEEIRSHDCRKFAMDNFTMERIQWQYEEYFNMLLDVVQGKGWSVVYSDRSDLNWLNKVY